MMNSLLLFGCLLSLLVLVKSNEVNSTSNDIDDHCLRCICMVETGCRKQSPDCHEDVGSLSCGYYQIKWPYYEDCGQPGGAGEDNWKKCANDYNCATTCVKKYTARYGSYCSGETHPTCEVYSRVHNGGPEGCRSSSTIGYWDKVKKCYG